ncbi:hypothetical protein [Anaeromassilibacillus senegalensis]|uniref:hypothetical protein n=1 Tax=Anaeromassilibacillus senegalensis TaxID=1673717 RepID=UPI0006819DE2|nr:hypothetical protein [Anaeromassilibacillus senegalensis]
MARITQIRKCKRPIRVESRTVMDINMDTRYFSMWVYAAGQESGQDLRPLSIQLDHERASQLQGYLETFLKQKE